VAHLKMSKRGLKLSAQENFNREDVLSFCNNILAAHRISAFGGKPALCDFFRDVATNLNRKKQGHRLSSNTKSFSPAMKIYGGQRMYGLFTLNFAAPSFCTVKRQNKKGVRFVAGEHAAIFECIAQIYVEAKEAHRVHGLVPVILAENKTKVKTHITWEPQTNVLASFCRTKEGHVCIINFKLEVGSEQEGYAKIVDAFKSNKMGGFARVVMVNPLHDKLPRLVLTVSCTCNCFDSGWVDQ
jgi:hypothetical protein